jgi:hypothetical protein
MSHVWVKAACSINEQALKVEFVKGMDFHDLAGSLITLRKTRQFKCCNVAKICIRTENFGHITYKEMEADDQVIEPTNETIVGFNTKNPYFFLSDLGIVNCSLMKFTVLFFSFKI